MKYLRAANFNALRTTEAMFQIGTALPGADCCIDMESRLAPKKPIESDTIKYVARLQPYLFIALVI